MRYARKIYMSIFTTLFILITCVATTFAWVGMFTTANLGSFDLNLKVVDIDAEYVLKISSDGNQFDDSINSNSVKRQILKNMGFSQDVIDNVLDEGLDAFFYTYAVMEPVTTDKDLTEFYSMDNLKNSKPFLKKCSNLFKFDIYLAIDTLDGISVLSPEELNSLNINANVFFENIDSAITGVNSRGNLINPNPFSTIPSDSDYACLNGVDYRDITINTKNSSRLAFQIYEPIPINSSYLGNELPMNTIIYQGGKQIPSVNNGVYDLGGILPEEYNLALREINSTYNCNVKLDNLNVDSNDDGVISTSERIGYLGAYERYANSTDLEMVEANNKIWNSPTAISGTNYLGIQNGIQTKMKVSIYFWYEGYDSDCLNLIDFKPTTLSISLSTDMNS